MRRLSTLALASVAAAMMGPAMPESAAQSAPEPRIAKGWRKDTYTGRRAHRLLKHVRIVPSVQAKAASRALVYMHSAARKRALAARAPGGTP